MYVVSGKDNVMWQLVLMPANCMLRYEGSYFWMHFIDLALTKKIFKIRKKSGRCGNNQNVLSGHATWFKVIFVLNYDCTKIILFFFQYQSIIEMTKNIQNFVNNCHQKENRWKYF